MRRSPGRTADRFPLRHLAAAAALVVVLLGAVRPVGLAAQARNFQNYGTREGLPQSQVLAIHQDRRGFLWIGTSGGAARFDGRTFRSYSADHGLRANSISDIAEDAAGRIVMATVGGGICRLVDESFACLGMEDGLPSNEVRAILPGPGGELLVATERGVARLIGEQVRVVPVGPGAGHQFVTRLARDRRGRLWAGSEAGLLTYLGGTFGPDPAAAAAGAPIRLLHPVGDGVLFGTPGGLFLRQADGLERLPIELTGDWRILTDAGTAPDGVVWISTRAGVLRWDGETFTAITTEHGLGYNQVNRVRLDREGSIWFGTDLGLSRLGPGPFTTYREAEGLPNAFVRTISEDSRGRLWVGTRSGVAYRVGDRFHPIAMLQRIPDPRVYALAALPGGRMLVGTRSGLALVDDSGLLRLYTERDGLPNAFILSLLPAPDGSIWVGTGSGMVRWSADGIERAPHPLLGAAIATSLLYDRAGRLLVGQRAGGLLVWDGSQVMRLGRAEGLSDQTIWQLAHGPGGEIWAGTNGDGVFRLSADGRVAGRLTTRDGLTNGFVWQVATDTAGGVWLYTSQGLNRWTPSGVRTYGWADGLEDLEGAATAAFRDRDGTMWFGSALGLYRYDAAADQPIRVAPLVYVDALHAGSQLLGDSGRVQPGSGPVHVRYASPHFRDPQSITFRYRLRGLSDQWSEPTSDPGMSWARLTPGAYHFEVVARDRDGNESEVPATISFTVLPAFWQSWWFQLLGLAALAGLIAGAVRYRTGRLEADRQQLQALVVARTRELEAQNARLEQEVHERLQVEHALRIKEERLRDVVEHSTNMFYAHTPDHILTYVSPQSVHFTGLTPAEAMIRWTELLTDNPLNAIGAERTQAAIDTGEKQPNYELELQHQNGHTVWVQVNEAPVVRDGKTVAVVGSLTDITESRRARDAEQRLEVQLRQAQKMEAIGRLAGGVAHDFNNLLTSVSGYTELVCQALPSESPIQEDLSEIRRASDRAATLVAQLLAFSRQQMVRPRAMDLNAAIGESSRMLSRLIGSDIKLVEVLHPTPCWIRADPNQIDQILLNLVVNARDAITSGGRITIGTALETAPADDGLDGESVEWVVLEVADTGEGMTEEVRARVFEPFFTTKAQGRGTGLGLAMVYGIVEQNGGQISLDTSPGAGARFRIRLPRVAEAVTTGSSRAATPAHAPAPLTDRVILVVEDEDSVRQLVSRTLRQSGFHVLEAADGTAAMHLADQHDGPIDLALVDMIMPGMNGKQVADWIRDRRPGTRVLFMSGHARDTLGSRGMLSEGVEMVLKPFTPDGLRRKVTEMVAEGAAETYHA